MVLFEYELNKAGRISSDPLGVEKIIENEETPDRVLLENYLIEMEKTLGEARTAIYKSISFKSILGILKSDKEKALDEVNEAILVVKRLQQLVAVEDLDKPNDAGVNNADFFDTLYNGLFYLQKKLDWEGIESDGLYVRLRDNRVDNENIKS